MEEFLMWRVLLSSQAQKDEKNLKGSLKHKKDLILSKLLEDPFYPYPPYEKLLGDLKGFYSRRINIQHRIVYEVLKEEKIVKVLRIWTHYE